VWQYYQWAFTFCLKARDLRSEQKDSKSKMVADGGCMKISGKNIYHCLNLSIAELPVGIISHVKTNIRAIFV
jgi:hypothetical protein